MVYFNLVNNQSSPSCSSFCNINQHYQKLYTNKYDKYVMLNNSFENYRCIDILRQSLLCFLREEVKNLDRSKCHYIPKSESEREIEDKTSSFSFSLVVVFGIHYRPSVYVCISLLIMKIKTMSDALWIKLLLSILVCFQWTFVWFPSE